MVKINYTLTLLFTIILILNQNLASSQLVNVSQVAIAPIQTNTYISFYDFWQIGQSGARYVVVDSNNTVQINTLHTENIPLVVTAPKMAKDSSNKVHFGYQRVNLFNAATDRILYKNENNLSGQSETVPFPYANGNPLNGFAAKSFDIAVLNDTPYIASYGINYNQGIVSSTEILISKRTQSGWTTPITLFQSSNFIYPDPQLALEFDQNQKGHLFFQVFSNPNCLGINCARDIYELVFNPTNLNVTINTPIIPITGPIPSAVIMQPIVSRQSSLAYLRLFNSSSNPRDTLAEFATSQNGWIKQTRSTSTIPIQDLSAASVDLTSDSSNVLDLVATEKNTFLNSSKIILFTSRNNGLNWKNKTLLSSSTSHYRDILSGVSYAPTNNKKELNIAFVEGIFGPISPFDKLRLIKQGSTGTNNLLVYQNPLSQTIITGDLLIT